MAQWRVARDGGEALLPGEQAELEALIEAELYASANRTSALADKMESGEIIREDGRLKSRQLG